MELTVGGRKAYAYTGGRPFDAARPTLVFTHGAAGDHSVWLLQSRYFAHHGYGVLAVDLPGHGRSAGPPLDSIAAMADWLLELLACAGAERFALAGHSMGSLISLEAAARAGEKASALVLIGTAYPMPVSEELLTAARDDEPLAHRMMNVWGYHPAKLVGGNRNPGVWLAGSSLALMDRSPKGVTYVDLKACNEYRGGETAAAEVGCRTVAILGERDQMTHPKSGKALMQRIRGAQAVVIPGAGHWMMAEQPDRVLDELIRFLS